MTGTATAQSRWVVGLGQTGLSLARFLAARGLPFAVADSRPQPPGLDALRAELGAGVAVHCGPFDVALFSGAAELLVSPGVPLDEPAIAGARAAGVRVRGDIDLFREEATAPVAAITGSNGKSTVTALLAAMAHAAGVRVAAGGNFGTPALELLDPGIELYVLELSSFQLERSERLAPAVATVLNVSPDHMDRYADLETYASAKQRIYRGAECAVVNRADPLSAPAAERVSAQLSFGLDAPGPQQFGLRGGQIQYGDESLLPLAAVAMAGRHNLSNALAALALGTAVGLPRAPMLETLRGFSGLAHRCQFVARRGGVDFYNDSKATNVGAAQAAIDGLCQAGADKVVLIAGGDGKGADFQPLATALARHGRAAVLLGRDAPRLAAVLEDVLPLALARDMDEAVMRAAELARPGDAVLLSPACASFDMFDDYAHRGEVFTAAVRDRIVGGGA